MIKRGLTLLIVLLTICIGGSIGKSDGAVDPTLAYSTYLGGSGADYGTEIAIDSSGNAYVSGGGLSQPISPSYTLIRGQMLEVLMPL